MTDENVEGYSDGRDPDSPDPSANRSASYRHSFAVGRAEISGGRIERAAVLRARAEAARAEDDGR